MLNTRRLGLCSNPRPGNLDSGFQLVGKCRLAKMNNDYAVEAEMTAENESLMDSWLDSSSQFVAEQQTGLINDDVSWNSPKYNK